MASSYEQHWDVDGYYVLLVVEPRPNFCRSVTYRIIWSKVRNECALLL